MTTMAKIADPAEQIRAYYEEWRRQSRDLFDCKYNLCSCPRDKFRQARAVKRVTARKARVLGLVQCACLVPLDTAEARRALEAFADRIEVEGSEVGDADLEMVELRLAQQPRRPRPAKARQTAANVVQLRQPAPPASGPAANPLQEPAKACREQQRNLDRLGQVLGRRVGPLRSPAGGS